jgi:large conductance mechanosensitive channel
MGFFKEFKEFAMRGNVIDLAVGLILGASFGKIVDVFVNGLLLPPIGLLTDGLNLADKKIILRKAVIDASGNITEPENAIRYGDLIQAIIVFLITVFAVLILVRSVNKLKRVQAAKTEAGSQAEIPPQEKLLTEIRDILKSK